MAGVAVLAAIGVGAFLYMRSKASGADSPPLAEVQLVGSADEAALPKAVATRAERRAGRGQQRLREVGVCDRRARRAGRARGQRRAMQRRGRGGRRRLPLATVIAVETLLRNRYDEIRERNNEADALQGSLA